MLFQCRAGHGHGDRRACRRAAGDDERRLGQAVARVDRGRLEAVGRILVGESLERLGPDRLGAVEGDAPAAQVEPVPLLGRDLVDAEVVGEIRGAADRAPGTSEMALSQRIGLARNVAGAIR